MNRWWVIASALAAAGGAAIVWSAAVALWMRGRDRWRGIDHDTTLHDLARLDDRRR